MHFPSSHRRTLCVTPKSLQSVTQKLIFFTFCVAFYVFVAGNCRHFKFGVQINHSKSQPTDYKLSLKRAR